MKNALITGITGQDGSYLAELLLEKGYNVYGIMRRKSVVDYGNVDHIKDKINFIYADMTDPISLISAMKISQADEVYNLAAQSFVATSWDTPIGTAEIEAGKREAVMRVGNLSAKRDFTDVRDVIRAYALIMEHGKAGETYNVGSGHAVSIQEILDTIVSFSKADIKVEVDPAKLRPVDVPIIEADIRKLVECTGWKREIPLERTIEETLDYWRKEVK